MWREWPYSLGGVCIALAIGCVRTRNLSGHPLRSIALRVLPRFLVALALGFPLAACFFGFVPARWLSDISPSAVALMLGIAPSLAFAWLAKFAGSRTVVVRQLTTVASIFNSLTDWFFSGLELVLVRLDRAFLIETFAEYGDRPINKLYAYHKVAIARERAAAAHDGVRKACARHVMRVTTPQTKHWFLLAHLGRAHYEQALKKITADPASIFPEWDGNERRRVNSKQSDPSDPGPNAKATQKPSGSRCRDYDKADTQKFAEGEI